MKQNIVLFVFALIAAGAGWYWQSSSGSADNAQAYTPAVAALVKGPWKDANNQDVVLRTSNNETLVVNFWATWCPPCIKEMPELSLLATELSAKRVRFVGIGIDSPSKIREFTAKTPISYPLIAAGFDGAEVAKNLGNSKGGLPYTVLIGPKGNVIETIEGVVDIATLRSKLALITANK